MHRPVHWAFPSHKVEVGGTAEEAAVKAVDLWLWAAVRKGGESDAVDSAFSICPRLAKRMHRALSEMQCIGEFEGTTYFGCKLDELEDHIACFHAARAEDTIASFRLTEQQSRQFNSFGIVKVSDLRVGVGAGDILAAAAAKEKGVAA